MYIILRKILKNCKMDIEANVVIVFTDNVEKYQQLIPKCLIHENFTREIAKNIVHRSVHVKKKNTKDTTIVIYDYKDDKQIRQIEYIKHMILYYELDDYLETICVNGRKIETIKISDKVREFAEIVSKK